MVSCSGQSTYPYAQYSAAQCSCAIFICTNRSKIPFLCFFLVLFVPSRRSSWLSTCVQDIQRSTKTFRYYHCDLSVSLSINGEQSIVRATAENVTGEITKANTLLTGNVRMPMEILLFVRIILLFRFYTHFYTTPLAYIHYTIIGKNLLTTQPNRIRNWLRTIYNA